jgi:hypothetical protein
MSQSLTPLDMLLLTIVLAALAVGLPILVVLSIRFLWNRHLDIGRAKDLEKLIGQFERIAGALEHRINLSSPSIHPGTGESRDLTYVNELASQPNPATHSAEPLTDAAPASLELESPKDVTRVPAAQPIPVPPHAPEEPTSVAPRRAGVNSMFGF